MGVSVKLVGGKKKGRSPKTRAKRKKPKTTKEMLSLVGEALRLQELDGAVVQDCLFRVVEKKAPLCVLIQGLEFRQVGSLLVIQPKPKATIEAAM